MRLNVCVQTMRVARLNLFYCARTEKYNTFQYLYRDKCSSFSTKQNETSKKRKEKEETATTKRYSFFAVFVRRQFENMVLPL